MTNTAVRKTEKVSNPTIFGYGIGALGFNTAATLFFVFFLFFLTTGAGFDPAISGLIILIAVLWDGITDPLIGHLSDKSQSRLGKRRPFILAGSVPLFVLCILMFTDVDFVSGTGKLFYFVAINMLFWLAFTTVDIPWQTLGSEITEDYNERTKLRTVSSVFMQVGALVVLVGSPLMIGYGAEAYGSGDAGWVFMATVWAVVILISYLIAWRSTRGKEMSLSYDTDSSKFSRNIFSKVGMALKNRSMRYLLGVATLLVASLSGILPAVVMFLLTFNLGLTNEADQSAYMGVYAICAIIFTPVVGWASTRFASSLGRAKVLGWFTLIAGCIIVAGKFIGATPVMTLIMLAAAGCGGGAFWLLIYVLAYDVAAVESYKAGENKDGLVISIMSFSLKFAMAVGMGLSGVLLSLFGFDENSATQTAEALASVETVFCIFGGIPLILGSLISFRFPITKAKYEALQEASEKKSGGIEYSEAAFADLL